MPSATIATAASSTARSIPTRSRNVTPVAAPPPRATDDEILGIVSPRKTPTRNADQLEFDFDAAPVAQAILPVPQTATSTIAPSSLTDEPGTARRLARRRRLPRIVRNTRSRARSHRAPRRRESHGRALLLAPPRRSRRARPRHRKSRSRRIRVARACDGGICA